MASERDKAKRWRPWQFGLRGLERERTGIILGSTLNDACPFVLMSRSVPSNGLLLSSSIGSYFIAYGSWVANAASKSGTIGEVGDAEGWHTE